VAQRFRGQPLTQRLRADDKRRRPPDTDEGYGWFTEGHDTLDLQEARTLLG